MRVAALVPVLVAAALSSCAALNPFRLDDQVALFHDDLRWGRMAAAESAITSAARADFTRRHVGWGRLVHIVDVEIENTRVNGFTGTARAHYTWTRAHELEIRETVVETRWKSGFDGSWHCENEEIIGGDPALLARALEPHPVSRTQ